MKQSKIKKAKLAAQKVVRVTYERDHDNPIWLDDATTAMPTPESHPNAFYQVVEDAYPRQPRPSTRLDPLDNLSNRKLANRLYQAGLRGNELKRIALEIKAGQPIGAMRMGRFALGWNVDVFKEKFGRRVTRAVLTFVKSRLIVMDEGWSLISAGMSKFIAQGMTTTRKHNGATFLVEQAAG